MGIVVASDVNIERPWNDIWWEKKHPHIAHNAIIFGTIYGEQMGEHISDLRLDEVDELDIQDDEASSAIFSAKGSASRYTYIKEETYSCVGEYWLCAGIVCIIMEEEMDEFTYRLAGIEDYVHGLDCLLSDITVADMETQWKGSMDYSMEALELSSGSATDTVDDAEKVYNKLKHAGLCDDSYTWNPGNSCKNLETAFNTIESGDESSNYGKVNLLQKNMKKFEEQLWEDEGPNVTFYYPLMELIWGENGVFEVYTDLKSSGEDAFVEADGIYTNLESETSSLKENVKDVSGDLEGHNLERITQSKTAFGVAEALESTGTIEERYETFEENKDEADDLYGEATGAYASSMEGYLADATVKMDEANSIYENLEEKAEDILDDAEEIVDEKKDEADEAIENAEDYAGTSGGTDAQDALDQAKAKRDEADRTESLGDRYLLYVKAIELAEGVMGERTAEEEIGYNTLVEEVRGLLGDAERDYIDVADLQAEFDYIETAEPSNAVSLLESIKREIEERARLTYWDLQNQRDELYEMLTAADADDLLDEMGDAERGIVFSGRIDYLKGIGGLDALSNEYDRIADELESDEQKRNDALANQMIVETSLLIEPVRIDDTTGITYVVTVMNPKNYGGYEIEVRVPLEGEFNFMYSDAVSGSEDLLNVRTEGSTMYLLFGEISPFEREVVSFEKSVILATTRSVEIEAVGLGDGSARVDETVAFELDANNVRVELPESSGILIDDLDPNRPLSEGIHSMTRSYTVYDAYSEIRSDAIVAATETEATVSYTITIEPEIDLVEVPVIADIGSDEYIVDVSIDCGIYDCVSEDSMGTYVITVYNLMEGISAAIDVSYTITKLDDYITVELEKYRGSQESEIRELVDEIEVLLGAGNYEAAMQKLEELKKKDSEIEKEKAKLLKKYYELARKINNEIEDLETALSKAEELGISNNTEVMKLETRKQTLENELSKMNISDESARDEIQAAVDDLGKIDMNWLKKEVTAISKQAGKDFGNYKKEFAEYDNATATSMLKQLETDINVLLATGKATDMVIVIADLDSMKGTLQELQDERTLELENLQLEFDDLKDTAETLLRKYESEYTDAKKYGMENLFPATPKSVNSLLSKTQKLLEDENAREAAYNIEDEIPEAIEKMEDTLKLLSSNAYRKLDEIGYELEVKRAEFSGEQIAQINSMKSDAEAALSAGNYIQAIKKASEAIGYIKTTKGKGNTALYLVLASVFIVGALAAYILYQKKKKHPKMKLGKEKLEKSKEKFQEPKKE